MKKAKLQEPKKVRIKGKVFWKVISPLPGGGSQRKFFKEKTQADTHFEQQKIELENFGAAGAAMDAMLRAQAVTAERILKPLGYDLVTAATYYASQMKAKTGGIPLSVAVDKFKTSRDIQTEEEEKKKEERRKRGDEKEKVESEEETVSEYSKGYKIGLKSRLKTFLAAFPNATTSQITSDSIEAFLKSIKNLETRRTYRRSLRALFGYLVEEDILIKSPVKKGPKQKVVLAIEVLTPSEAKKLLNLTYLELIPSVVLRLFCAIRACEIEKLVWEKIDLKDGVVNLEDDVVKQSGSRRMVPIHATCKKWLELIPLQQRKGKVLPRESRKLFDLVRVKAGFKPSYSKSQASGYKSHSVNWLFL